MNRVCALSVVFLFGSLAAIAQALPDRSAAPATNHPPVPPRSQIETLQIEPYSATSCPAGIKVKQQGIPRLVYVTTVQPEGPSIGIRIIVSNSRQVGISSVRIAVRGYAESHLTPMTAGVAGSGEVGKTFRVGLKAPPGGTASTEVWANGFVSVTSVELTGVAYADGSAWRPPTDHRCRISAPNLYVTGAGR